MLEQIVGVICLFSKQSLCVCALVVTRLVTARYKLSYYYYYYYYVSSVCIVNGRQRDGNGCCMKQSCLRTSY